MIAELTRSRRAGSWLAVVEILHRSAVSAVGRKPIESAAMGAIRPWHIATLLCCLASVAIIAGGVWWAVAAARKKK